MSCIKATETSAFPPHGQERKTRTETELYPLFCVSVECHVSH